LTRTTPVSQVMTSKVRTIEVQNPLSAVRSLVATEKFHHVPIVDGHKLVGIISSRDLVQVYRHRGEEPSIAETMSTDLVTMRLDDSIEKAIDTLADGAVHSLLVIGDEDRLAGIVTNIDLLDYLFE
jgi:CBS domain-containing protein